MKHTQLIVSFAAAACAAVVFVCLADVNRDTYWQDVPPDTRVGEVVDLGSGGSGGGGVDTNTVRAIAGSVSTNVVRDLSLGGIWDSSLQVWWTPRMANGKLTYCATTNVNMNAGGNQ